MIKTLGAIAVVFLGWFVFVYLAMLSFPGVWGEFFGDYFYLFVGDDYLLPLTLANYYGLNIVLSFVCASLISLCAGVLVWRNSRQ